MRIAVVFLLAACLTAARAQAPNTATSPAAAAANPDTVIAAAQAELQQGKYAEAIAALRAIAAAHPRQKGVEHDLGLAYYRSGRLPEARESFAHAIASDPGDLESVQMEGLTLYRMGQPEAAIPYLERVRQWAPNADADANYVLGLCYIRAGKFDAARQAFAAQYGVESDSGAAHLLLARMLMKSNLAQQSAEEARKALAMAQQLPLAHFLLGEIALYESNLDQAAQEFEAERAIDPAYAPVYDRLGDVYSRVGKYQQAQQALMKSLSLDTSNTGPFILLGKVLLEQKDPQSALLYLRHAEKMDPGNFLTHDLLSRAYRDLGQQQPARQEADAAAKLHAGADLRLSNPR